MTFAAIPPLALAAAAKVGVTLLSISGGAVGDMTGRPDGGGESGDGGGVSGRSTVVLGSSEAEADEDRAEAAAEEDSKVDKSAEADDEREVDTHG